MTFAFAQISILIPSNGQIKITIKIMEALSDFVWNCERAAPLEKIKDKSFLWKREVEEKKATEGKRANHCLFNKWLLKQKTELKIFFLSISYGQLGTRGREDTLLKVSVVVVGAGGGGIVGNMAAK